MRSADRRGSWFRAIRSNLRAMGSAPHRVLRAARLQKILPLLILLVTWERLGAEPGDAPGASLAVALLFVLSVGALGMHLNVLTDVDLDRERKPELYADLTASMRAARLALALELGLAAGAGLFALWASPRLAAALWACGALSVLYSFNFLVFWAPRRYRLKLSAWGNALTVLGGYGLLRLAGLWASPIFGRSDPPVPLSPAWLCFLFGSSLVDYGLFLAECALDAEEERRHHLRTLAARLGRWKTTVVGFGISLVAAGIMNAAWWRLGAPQPTVGPAVVLALLIPCAGAGLCVALGRDSERSRVVRVIDGSFWASRLLALASAVSG